MVSFVLHATFFLTEYAIAQESWKTAAIWVNKSSFANFLISIPLMRIRPDVGVYKPHNNFIKVVLPAPLLPTIPIFSFL